VTNCREGQILLSIPPIGHVQAATFIATIGNIANFEKASELKSYFGWAPRRHQTGVTFDRTKLTRAGVRPVKQMLFLMAAWLADKINLVMASRIETASIAPGKREKRWRQYC